MKTLKEILYKELDIKESFEIPTKLLEKMLGSDRPEFLSKISEIYNYEEDSLRDLFQQEQSNRKDFMQDYTPDCICKIFQKIVGKSDELLDICSGTGALTISAVKDNKVQYLQCEELSSASIPYLLLNLSLRNLSGRIYQKDVITRKVETVYQLTNGEKFSTVQKIDNSTVKDQFDLIISNPPYSLSYTPDENDTRFQEYVAPPKSRADYLFVLDAIERLKQNGKAFFILPHGVLFRSSQEYKIRKQLIENNLLEAVIGLPDNLFMNTQIPTVILVFNKDKKDTNTLFIDGSKCFTKGKNTNYMNEEHVKKFVETYNNKKEVQYFSRIVKLEEIKENDFNLNIPRYIQEERIEKEINIDEILKELQKIDEDTKKTVIELKELTGQLEYRNYDGTVNEEKTKNYHNNVFSMIDLMEKDGQIQEIEDVINSVKRLDDDISTNYEWKKLTDLVKIERAKKGKTYKAGSIKIQMSATRGQMFYLATDQEVETYYAVMEPITEINTFYLFEILQEDTERFLSIYQTGLNITTDIFDYWEVPIHKKIETQNQFAKILYDMNNLISQEETAIQFYQDYKDFHLQKLLP